jgi:hypothetical protein
MADVAAHLEDLKKDVANELRFHKRNWVSRTKIYNAVFGDIRAIDERLRTLLSVRGSRTSRSLPRGTAPPAFPKTVGLIGGA